MISSITANGTDIKLRNSSVGDINIYSMDSLSLLIGINGSGKTKCLCSIISHFFPKNNMQLISECNIWNSRGERIDNSEIKNWGVIYFTPLPFRPKLDIRNNRFINASPAPSGRNTVFDLIGYEDLISDFGISPKVVAMRTTNISKIARLILNIALDNKDLNKDSILLNHGLANILSLREEIDSNNYNSNNDNTGVYNNNKNIQTEIDHIMERCSAHLIDTVHSDIGEDKLFSIFSIIDWASTKKQFNNNVVVSLLNRYLGLNIRLNRKYRENKLQFECENKIDSLFYFLKHEVADYNITRNSRFNEVLLKLEFEIKPYEGKEILTKYNLNDIFKIEFSEMSSGQTAILAQIGAISDSITKLSDRGITSILLLIDEGDAFLHMDWQRKYISSLNKMLGKLKVSLGIKHLQLILATHSPLLATDVPKDFISRLSVENNALSGFASPLYILLNESFGTKTIGEFATDKIEKIFNKIPYNNLTEEDHYLIENIDNPLIKNEIERLVLQYKD
ncbi:TPA: AAA family ATPase [Yersinia enterocolitica]|nr:AAA family ATPase [Yersinia enterocolitica]HDM8384944.1 AAA family ATPase [Yersinia enterocolitica]